MGLAFIASSSILTKMMKQTSLEVKSNRIRTQNKKIAGSNGKNAPAESLRNNCFY